MKHVANPHVPDERITRLLAYYLWECRGRHSGAPDHD